MDVLRWFMISLQWYICVRVTSKEVLLLTLLPLYLVCSSFPLVKALSVWATGGFCKPFVSIISIVCLLMYIHLLLRWASPYS